MCAVNLFNYCIVEIVIAAHFLLSGILHRLMLLRCFLVYVCFSGMLVYDFFIVFACFAFNIVRFLCTWSFFVCLTFDMKRNFLWKIYIPFRFSSPLHFPALSSSFSVSVRLFAVVFFYHYYYFAVAFIKSRYKWWNGIYTEIITLGRGMKCKSENYSIAKRNIQMPRITTIQR